ncbi:MAG: anti-sigma factor [Actinomycetota bacterium]
MNAHEELELLSAFLDGELTDAERLRVDAHLPGCAECRATLDALRATLGDLGSLPRIEMDETSASRFDTHLAVRRSRRPSTSRVWFSGAAAAAIIGLIASFAILRHPAFAPEGAPKALGAAAGSSGIETSDTDYTAASARAALGEYPSKDTFATGHYDALTAENAQAESGAGTTFGATRQYAPAATGADARFRECATSVERGADLQTVRYLIARFNGERAFFLFYLAPAQNATRAEVWVLRPSDCFTLYFAQRKL